MATVWMNKIHNSQRTNIYKKKANDHNDDEYVGRSLINCW